MIISKTPLRISFFGGGTDYPDYIKKYGGAVLSTSINKYVYLTVNKISDITQYKYKVSYSKLEHCQTIDELVHPSIRECLRFMDIKEGIEIHTMSDLPALTGLGSSSSFTVGLLNALTAYQGKTIAPLPLAQNAIYVEQKMIGEKVGVQDQCAAAVGGLNYFEFSPDGSITYKPVMISAERKMELKNNLLLFYTGVQRFADVVLKEQIEKTQKNEVTKELLGIGEMAKQGFDILTSDSDLSAFGKLLHKAWESKKNLSTAISNAYLDNIYDTALNAGILGGKLLGAGGGGFFLFYAEQDTHEKIRHALKDYQEIAFDFDVDGSQNIFMTEN